MEVIKTCVMLLGIVRCWQWGGVDKPQHGFGVNIVGIHSGNEALCFERLDRTYAVYSHPGPVIYWQHYFPGPRPWRFKPRYTPGTLEGLPK